MSSGGNIASQSQSPSSPPPPPLLRRLPPLLSRNSSSSNSTMVGRGIINHKLTRKSNNQEQQQEENRQHVHLSDNNNRAFLTAPSSSINTSPFSDDDAGHSKEFEATTLLASAEEELDCFLDLYEEQHGLEPLDMTMSQVQGLSTTSKPLLVLLSRLITGATRQDGVVVPSPSSCYQKTAQISQRDSRKTPIKSPLRSLDLSCLPVAPTLSQDDIQDSRSLSNNNSKDLEFRGKQQPLSPIRKDKRNVTKNRDDHDDDRQSGMKAGKVENNAEVKNGKSASAAAAAAAAAVKKTSTPKRAGFAAVPPPPPPQQPQRIDNSKTAIVIGENEKKKKKIRDCKENCTTIPAAAAPELSTPKCLGKLPIERRIPSEAVSLSGPTSTVVAKSHRLSAASHVQQSKIPVPLPKTKINTAAVNESRNDCRRSSASSKSSKICTDNDAVRPGEKIRNNNNNPTTSSSTPPPSPLKKQLIIPHKVIPVSHKVTLGTKSNPKSSTCGNNKNNDGNPPKATTTPERKIGQGDELSEYLRLIDGLSRQTTWVMNKVLEIPVSDEDAAVVSRTRINNNKLKESPEIGDFFGAPYIKKEALTHMLFTNGHFSINLPSSDVK